MSITFTKDEKPSNVIQFKKKEKGDDMEKSKKKKLLGAIGGGLALGGALLAVLDHLMKNGKTEEVDSILLDEPADVSGEFPGVGGEDE